MSTGRRSPAGRPLGRRLKGWPGWVLLLFALVGFLAVGVARDGGPRTPDERVESISKRVACPVCQGESVFESRHPTAENIKAAIQDRVDRGVLSDDEIIQSIVGARQGQELLVPTADGIEALAWALPATAFVVGAAGLAAAFRRWQRNSAALGPATEADVALVAEAMRTLDDGGGTTGSERAGDPGTAPDDDGDGGR